MSAPEVLSIIASLNGGFNGNVPGKEIQVQIVSDTEAIYTLRQWVDDAPTDQVEAYRLSLVEFTPEPDEPVVARASEGEAVDNG
ncbi:hypothetical protein SEA_MILANI_23 [Microbacterium phage Milani]|nr:hypothetical protein SEA_MILANI_23 [Microbacterium phage Milani]